MSLSPLPSVTTPLVEEHPNGSKTIQVAVTADDEGLRLDRFLANRLPEISRSRIVLLLRGGYVACAGRTIGEPSRRVKLSEAFQVTIPPPEPAEPEAETIPLNIVYEDSAIIVLDKPVGMVVHPAPGHRRGTLVNALLAHCEASLSGIGGIRRPGIVHRLDKDTSGLLVAAKTDAAHQALSAQFADHGRTGPLERAYLAFAWGAPRRSAGRIDKPLGRHPNDRLRQAIRPKDGRRAITHYERLATFGSDKSGASLASLNRCRLETGRTHQIRVHLAALGCPLIADDLYGRSHRTKAALLPDEARETVETLNRQALHAELLVFAHPDDARIMRFESAIPADLQGLHDLLNKI